MKLYSMVRGLAVPVALALCASVVVVAQTPPATSTKPRLVITADPELDDVNTLIRALLYATDFKIEGLVYASSGVHWKGDGKGTTQYIPGREYTRFGNHAPLTSWRWAQDDRFIDDVVDAYAKVYANLTVHNAAYPAPAELRSAIKWGNAEFDGDYSKDTDGSNLIKALLLDNQPGPLFVAAQGGQSTIARALKSIYDQYSKTQQWTAIREKISRKLIIIPWGDQDGTNSRYIRPNWPDVATWTLAMINFGYGARGSHTPENQVFLGAEWTRDNVSSRGVLGAMYRVWGDGKQMVKGDMTDYFGLSGVTADQLREQGYFVWTAPQEKGSFISEGDTPTFMNLLDNGLRAHEDGSWGGWGGRRNMAAGAGRGGGAAAAGAAPGPGTPVGPDDPGIGIGIAPAGSTANAPTPAAATAGGAPAGGAGRAAGAGGPGAGGGRGAQAPTNTTRVNARFFAAAQQDFAARLKWSVTPRLADANHEPKVQLKGSRALTASPGATVRLEGEVSDPDRDQVTVNWWQYHDAGTYPGDIALTNASALTATFQVPADAQPGQTIHVLLEATDRGVPALTRYQRVVVTVR
jgi:hypothetical protein